jgi:hypothetical protein
LNGDDDMSKISLGQIDLEALQQYLEIVVGFRKQNDKSHDVEEVDGVPAELIAKAAVDEDGNLLLDRDTVKNALQLNGVDASEYLKRTEGDLILTDTNLANYNLASDILNLKDELYQLKNQLIKSGTLRDSNVYNGFIDAFLSDEEKHLEKSGAVITSSLNNSIVVDNANVFCEGEYIALVEKNRVQRGKILSIESPQLHLDTAFVMPNTDFNIYKSIGVNSAGKFIFANQNNKDEIVVDENKYIVKDGINRIKVFELLKPKHGFGTEIIVPSSLENNKLSKIQVSLAVKGNPGNIQCVLYKYNESAKMFEETGIRSNTLSSLYASAWFNNFTFNFPIDIKLVPGERYIPMFVTSDANEDNKWYIGGFAEDNCENEIHDDCYIVEGNSLYRTLDDKDMFLILFTKRIDNTQIDRLNFGLYSCEFDTNNTLANRVRVELMINKEGMYRIAKDGIVSNNNDMISIPIEPKDGKYHSEDMFVKNDIAIVNKEFGPIYSNTNNATLLINKEDMYVKPNADIYRMGYKVQAIASNRTYVNGEWVDSDKELYVLNFVGVMPGKDLVRPDQSSDRLLFECELCNQEDDKIEKLKSFNHIEVQVIWNSNISATTIKGNIELEGSIFDIAVSVDQAFIKKPQK